MLGYQGRVVVEECVDGSSYLVGRGGGREGRARLYSPVPFNSEKEGSTLRKAGAGGEGEREASIVFTGDLSAVDTWRGKSGLGRAGQ